MRPAPSIPTRLVVRIDLLDVEPAIWRRLELASDLTLADVHHVLQASMGWSDSHLHQFIQGTDRDHRVNPFVTDVEVEQGGEGVREGDVRLDQVLVEIGDVLYYDYDFGDGWEHRLLVEEVVQAADSAPRARLLDGARACPPEDCGGVPGYEQLLAALAAGRGADEDQRDLLVWLDADHDPESFLVEETDALVRATTSALGGIAGVTSALTAAGSALSPVLTHLVERSRQPKPLTVLVARAELAPVEVPDDDAVATTMRPWQHFLDVVGAGLPLTSAGWLPPAVVHRIATELDLLEPWMGKGNREQHLPPVRNLRESAVALGLARVRKGELLPTAAGLRVAGDPRLMWRHVTERLPLGRSEVERAAGVIMLLALAAGEKPSDGIRRHGGALLWSAGWMEGDGMVPSSHAAFELARPTWQALAVAGCDPRASKASVSSAARLLARAALRSS